MRWLTSIRCDITLYIPFYQSHIFQTHHHTTPRRKSNIHCIIPLTHHNIHQLLLFALVVVTLMKSVYASYSSNPLLSFPKIQLSMVEDSLWLCLHSFLHVYTHLYLLPSYDDFLLWTECSPWHSFFAWLGTRSRPNHSFFMFHLSINTSPYPI